LDVQVGDLEAAHGLVASRRGRIRSGDIAPARAPYPLVPARAERIGTLACQDHDPHVEILPGSRERIRELHDRLRPEGVAHLRAVDRDLRDPGVGAASKLVADVGVLAGWLPGDAHAR